MILGTRTDAADRRRALGNAVVRRELFDRLGPQIATLAVYGPPDPLTDDPADGAATWERRARALQIIAAAVNASRGAVELHEVLSAVDLERYASTSPQSYDRAWWQAFFGRARPRELFEADFYVNDVGRAHDGAVEHVIAWARETIVSGQWHKDLADAPINRIARAGYPPGRIPVTDRSARPVDVRVALDARITPEAASEQTNEQSEDEAAPTPRIVHRMEAA